LQYTFSCESFLDSHVWFILFFNIYFQIKIIWTLKYNIYYFYGSSNSIYLSPKNSSMPNHSNNTSNLPSFLAIIGLCMWINLTLLENHQNLMRKFKAKEQVFCWVDDYMCRFFYSKWTNKSNGPKWHENASTRTNVISNSFSPFPFPTNTNGIKKTNRGNQREETGHFFTQTLKHTLPLLWKLILTPMSSWKWLEMDPEGP